MEKVKSVNLFDLRESKTIIVYSIFIIILLFLLVFLNASEETEIENEKKFEKSSFTTVGIIVLIIIAVGVLFYLRNLKQSYVLR